VRGRANQKPSKILLSTRWITGKTDGGKLYASMSYVLHKNIAIGLDYRPLIDKVEFMGNWRILPERQLGKWSPALVLGTSREDYTIAHVEKESRAYYATLSKSLFQYSSGESAVNFSPYVGAAYLDAFDDLRLIGGLHVRKSKFAGLLQHSGRNMHVSVSYDWSNMSTVSFLFWGVDKGFDLPGLSLTYRY